MKRNNAFRRFLESGSEPLDREMRASLDQRSVNRPERPLAVPAAAPKKRRSLKAFLRRRGWISRVNAVCSIALCAALIALLLFTVMDMPYFGSADTLVESEVSEFYVKQSLEDTHAVNIISAIILNYRGFDTLGESHVLFIAVCSVLILLRITPSESGAHLSAYDYDESNDEPHDDAILKTCARFLFPVTVIFGLYIILNGNLSPGGGFSGGAIIGAGLILYLSVYGYPRIRRFFTYNTFRVLSCFALMTYALSKGYHFVTGANGLESGIPIGDIGSIFSGGLLLPLNICVGVVVACTMYALFTMFRKGDF